MSDNYSATVPNASPSHLSGTAHTPLLRPSSIVICMLSLSIGWGIRGNFGGSDGAMMPGALCALAICLFSGREDWRERAPFFALFGALGWAFGGAIAYMPTLAYTQSGHLPTQLYGFFACFCVGFLWASLGGAGTAFAATESHDRLTAIIRPVCWVLVIWTIQYFGEASLLKWYAGADLSEFRQRSSFYWLDTSWLTVFLALVALCAFDLWSRSFSKVGSLIAMSGVGAAGGALVHYVLTVSGLLPPILHALVKPQGDLTATDPATGRLFNPNNLVTNWPQLFTDLAPHMGWIVGVLIACTIYFYLYAEWQSGSQLLVEMALGSLAAFLLGPVLLTSGFMAVGGFRMMAPRADDWALVLGALLGLLHFAFRNKLQPVAFVALVSGLLGGLALMVSQFVKILMIMPGNPVLTSDPAVIKAWSHWHKANWHSIVAEQGVGLLYGLAVLLPMAALATRLPVRPGALGVRRWTNVFSVAFVLCVIVYLNLVHNVNDWTTVRPGGFASMPTIMKAPLLGVIQLSTLNWFNLAFLLYTVCVVTLLTVHVKRGLTMIPTGWLGKGQLIYLLFLWMLVIGNFERIMVVFEEQRLATEGTIFINALIATFMMLTFPRQDERVTVTSASLTALLPNLMLRGFAAMLLLIFILTGIVRGVYGNRSDGWGPRPSYRFGSNADWRLRPILKNREHR